MKGEIKLNPGAFYSGATGTDLTKIDAIVEIVDDCSNAGSSRVEIDIKGNYFIIRSFQDGTNLPMTNKSVSKIMDYGTMGEPRFTKNTGNGMYHVALTQSLVSLVKHRSSGVVRLYISHMHGKENEENWVIEWPVDKSNPDLHSTKDFEYFSKRNVDDSSKFVGFAYECSNSESFTDKDIYNLKLALGDRFAKIEKPMDIIVNGDNLYQNGVSWDQYYQKYGTMVEYKEMKFKGICTIATSNVRRISEMDNGLRAMQDRSFGNHGRKKDLCSHASSKCSIYLRGRKVCEVSHESIVGASEGQHFYDGLRSYINFENEEYFTRVFTGGAKKSAGKVQIKHLADIGDETSLKIVNEYKSVLDIFSTRYSTNNQTNIPKLHEDATRMAKYLGLSVKGIAITEVMCRICSNGSSVKQSGSVLLFDCSKKEYNTIPMFIFGLAKNGYTSDATEYFSDYTSGLIKSKRAV